MIPQRIRLRGFLCYREEQEVGFDGRSLWMLAGLNGSGKSAIFDAVTYALFGYHRGGQQNAVELVNKESDGLAVEFEFELDGQHYQARRTLKKRARGSPQSTQQLFRWRPALTGDAGAWEPVADTSRRVDFDTWVADNIGLAYETFTSSVLLLQGKAEKLLESTAKGRQEILAAIVDLGRYQRLHERADARRKAFKNQIENLETRLAGLEELGEGDLEVAESRIAAALAARTTAQAQVERLQALELQANRWIELQQRLATATQRRKEAERLAADAPAIERDVNRLRELRELLPRLQNILEQRTQIRDSDGRTRELDVQRKKVELDLAASAHALDQTAQKRSALQKRIDADEARHRDVATLLRQAASRLETLKEYERHEAELTQLAAELATLPADPAAAVTQAREALTNLTSLAQALPWLARLHEQRVQLHDALAAEPKARKAQETVEARGRQLATEVERLQGQLNQAQQEREAADGRATEARTMRDQVREALREVSELEGAKVCRHCGQSLTPGHVEEEKRRRGKELRVAEATWKEAVDVVKTAKVREQQLREQFTLADKSRQEAREEYRDAKATLERARHDSERLRGECGRAYAELAEPFRVRVSPQTPADWLAITYPAAEDVAAARAEVAALPSVQRKAQDAERVLVQWTNARNRQAVVREARTRLKGDLPGEPASIRAGHIRLEAEEKSLQQNLIAGRVTARETQEELDRLNGVREQTQRQQSEFDSRLRKEEALRHHCQLALQRLTKELPAAWQGPAERFGTAELFAWSREREDLIKADTDERGRQAQQAIAGLKMLRQDQEELERGQEAFPPEARREPAAVAELVVAARQRGHEREQELAQARQHRDQLDALRRQRAQLIKEKLRLDGELARARTLADLLGRDRLQLHLVRRAEHGIVDHANAVLDRLSGGQLSLKLREGDGGAAADEPLQLDAYNRTSGQTIHVAFLSGSQRFRVAVSLALGIGQYASRQHRPIESVIIDEGFGCLDRQSRQVMIQELQNLSGQLRCILLVSHQEEFADAFPHGYRFELENGSTRVTPLKP